MFARQAGRGGAIRRTVGAATCGGAMRPIVCSGTMMIGGRPTQDVADDRSGSSAPNARVPVRGGHGRRQAERIPDNQRNRTGICRA
ncbi:hypothetical protein [Burkholderia sp. 22313]|uniref:hypothetical protein n=1 Tax=Burkholderia sp. 22313 TaxID=3453908 RepID=UPI003F879917